MTFSTSCDILKCGDGKVWVYESCDRCGKAKWRQLNRGLGLMEEIGQAVANSLRL